MANSETTLQWTLVISLTAFFLSAVVTAQILSAYAKAYIVAPAEILNFVDAADSSVEENESYDHDVSRVQRLDDKLRLGRLLREIQRGGDDLREELIGLLVSESVGANDGTTDVGDLKLKATARLLWASKRKSLEDKVRRLDMLRMRFLVVYMGIVAAISAENNKPDKKLAPFIPPAPPTPPPDFLGRIYEDESASRRGLSGNRARTESIKKKLMPRRLSQARFGPQVHGDPAEGRRQQGWAGVMRELQMSPLLHKRHASVERSISPNPLSPHEEKLEPFPDL